MARAAVLAAVLAGSGCRHRPARFADAPPVVDAGDRAPIPVPETSDVLEAVYLSDVYVRRTLVDALDPTRPPAARDVNAVDEVPRSSWLDPPHGGQVAFDTADGPPVPPLRIHRTQPAREPSDLPVLAVRDARGLAYELRFDPPDRPAMRTGAAVAASRLVRLLGYRVPEVTLVSVREGDFAAKPPLRANDALAAALTAGSGALRAVAVRWPIGIDLGPTSPSASRPDDPNDRVPHPDRRTLRALGIIGAWLAIGRFDGRMLRDAYVGPPGRGHVRHYLAGLDGALGADDVVRARRASPSDEDDDGDDVSPWRRFYTLGLYRPPKRIPTQTEHPALGAIDERVDPADHKLRVPFEPLDRARPDDVYWAAKRIASIGADAIASAVAAAELGDAVASARLVAILRARRQALVAHGFAGVTPLEAPRLEAGALILRDAAAGLGIARVAAARHEATWVDEEGRTVATAAVTTRGDAVRVAIPQGLLDARDYAIARIVAVRAEGPAPRACEVHVTGSASRPRIVALRH